MFENRKEGSKTGKEFENSKKDVLKQLISNLEIKKDLYEYSSM